MTHDEIVEVIGEKFPGLSPTNPFNRRVVRGQTSFWIDNEKFKKFARVIRVKKEKPWELKRVASDLREKTRMDIEKNFDRAFLGTPSELVVLVREEIEILRAKARELNITLPADFETAHSLPSDTEVASEMNQLVEASRETVFFDPSDDQSGKTYIARSIAYRLGQTSFRNKLIARYGGRCCISGCEIMNIVEAAHIVPFNGESTNSDSNGLLLRSDLHTLFDLGLLRIDPETYEVLLHATVLADPDYEKLTVEPLSHLKGIVSKPALQAHFKRFAQT